MVYNYLFLSLCSVLSTIIHFFSPFSCFLQWLPEQLNCFQLTLTSLSSFSPTSSMSFYITSIKVCFSSPCCILPGSSIFSIPSLYPLFHVQNEKSPLWCWCSFLILSVPKRTLTSSARACSPRRFLPDLICQSVRHQSKQDGNQSQCLTCELLHQSDTAKSWMTWYTFL